jgi:hypothetical protein
MRYLRHRFFLLSLVIDVASLKDADPTVCCRLTDEIKGYDGGTLLING